MGQSLIPERIEAACREAAERFGTPLYLIDFDGIDQRVIEFRDAWSAVFSRASVAYSYKSNSLRALTRRLARAGLRAEVVSGAELEWAVQDGFSPDGILFDGPHKTNDELARAFSLGARVQLDSLDELDRALARAPEGARLSIRLACKYRAKGPSRFGMTPEEHGEALRRAAAARRSITGLHFHPGSNLLDPAAHAVAIEEFASQILTLSKGAGRDALLDLGGGYAASSAGGPHPPAAAYAAAVAGAFERIGLAHDSVELVLEPGRCLVEDFGWLVGRVVARKTRPEGPLLVSDAGLHLVRSLGAWRHPVVLLKRQAETSGSLYSVFGANCFESDQLAKGLEGPADAGPGDLLVIGEAGGYDIPSANAWIRPLPVIAGLEGKNLRLLRREQTPEEMRCGQEA